MKELIGCAVLIAAIYGGTVASKKIYFVVREAALSKAASGLPRLSSFAKSLTSGSGQKKERRP